MGIKNSRHLEEWFQLLHQTHTSSAVAGDVDAWQAAHASELRGLLEELILEAETKRPKMLDFFGISFMRPEKS